MIRIVGVGFSGALVAGRLAGPGTEVVVVDTDSEAVNSSAITRRFLLGEELTRGEGARGNAELGRRCALESVETIREMLQGASRVVVVAGLGGGTGSGVSPVIVEASRTLGLEVFVVASTPFRFEGPRRARIAAGSLAMLSGCGESVALLDNDGLLRVGNRRASVADAFEASDRALYEAASALVSSSARPDIAAIESCAVRAGLAFLDGRRVPEPARGRVPPGPIYAGGIFALLCR